jgi:hypothetical protein
LPRKIGLRSETRQAKNSGGENNYDGLDQFLFAAL